MRLTRQELDALPAKTKKDPRVVGLYMEHDFLTAYAMHTDLRVTEHGYKSAVGAVQDWERHGNVQFEFLKSQGLQPDHRLIEIGCGTGRLARKVVPYLAPYHYVGVDISSGALRAANTLGITEGWDSRYPLYSLTLDSLRPGIADYAWAFSVFIHLPADEVVKVLCRTRDRLKPAGKFFFSYVPERQDGRTGLKQFRHTEQTYRSACIAAGLTFDPATNWMGEQRIALARREA